MKKSQSQKLSYREIKKHYPVIVVLATLLFIGCSTDKRKADTSTNNQTINDPVVKIEQIWEHQFVEIDPFDPRPLYFKVVAIKDNWCKFEISRNLEGPYWVGVLNTSAISEFVRRKKLIQ